MNTTNVKEVLANKFNDYQERKKLGIDGMTVGIQERTGDTVEDIIYNKLYKCIRTNWRYWIFKIYVFKFSITNK